jgi:hypothetical protein
MTDITVVNAFGKKMMNIQLTGISRIVCCLAITAEFFVAGDDSHADELADILKQPILKPEQATSQHRKFVTSRIPELKLPASADAWQKEASRLRKKIRQQVVFRGVPKIWYANKPQIVFSDVIETDNGYKIRKLRYEALPGLWIPALLYEPDELKGNVPVVLNVNGHDRKAVRYKQLRCINLAKRGMLALNPEWIGMGQLNTPDYAHNHLAKLDLYGHSGLSVFFLAMSRGLDVLLDHKHTDDKRVAVTGLSGDGWQTIILSALDNRVTFCVPVAGYSSLLQRIVNRSSIGDLEQNPNDLVGIADYSHLTAMMVPRPTLLIYNDKDTAVSSPAP